MPRQISIDPLTRLEGHLSVKLTVDEHRVTSAHCAGEMYRGFENILKGRHPMDAQQITQRICGVCPISHGVASCLAQEEAYKISLTRNGRLLRNLIQAANYLQSHIIHFYLLSAVDFVDVAAILNYRGSDPQMKSVRAWVQQQTDAKVLYPAAPLLPRLEGNYAENDAFNLQALQHYVQALEIRQLAHQAIALFAGKMPHATGLVPGGVTEQVTPVAIAAFRSLIQKIGAFIEECLVPDVIAVAKAFPEYFSIGKGPGNFLSYGVFPENDNGNPADLLMPRGIVKEGALSRFDPGKITEEVRYSFFSSPSGLHPSKGQTTPKPTGKEEAYSWLKAPRYDGMALEVGPLARVMVAYLSKSPKVGKLVDEVLATFSADASALNSMLGRHAARAVESKLLVERCNAWLNELRPGEPAIRPYTLPEKGEGMGLWEAPRGALGHWIEIRGGKISNYQCVVPSTWNCSPRDDKGSPGPVELALEGTPIKDPDNPIEAARVVRSFDPCLACAVH